MTKRTLVLVILDGWGIGREDGSNPIHEVKPKNLTALAENFPMGSLNASGISVGLPWGEVGNSEVGHLTIGAGRTIYQYYPRITLAIRDGTFFSNAALKAAFEHARKNNSGINFVGLLTKANVHASLDHIKALLKMAEMENVGSVKLHLFADGKDSQTHTLEKFLEEIPKDKLATLMGRYYGMDRNQNWEVTQRAYDCMTGTKITPTKDLEQAIKENYLHNPSEEFLPPINVSPDKVIQDNDAVIFFNFREDSIRQISESFIVEGFDKFPVKNFDNLFIATMTHYEQKFSVPVAFPPDTVENCIGKVLSDAGKIQLRLAETYKYAHVTYFFNAYREQAFKNEYRVVVPSISAPRPEDHPEMMASAITDRAIEAITNRSFDFILINYANGDTMGHTGNFQAGVKAVEIVDEEVGKILKVAESENAVVVITSDHGNVEEMISPETGLPETQHDPNPVPIYLVAPEFKGRKFINWRSLSNEVTGVLSDVAPTILEIMEIQKPPEMNGESLLQSLI
ncbi:MAG TPA: 2,3-bisphosphoglycerate-independent phosphoglycerate mutase [Candidatus Paceibacterota bacterium]|nr:2,3-bisphosphoglycerate-independent phosphoglycerate mutase [Candidatus Paceibacterota bacterium]